MSTKHEEKPSNWFPVKQRFVVELEFDDINEETARQLILSCITKDTTILPNLYVRRFYNKVTSVESVIEKYKNDTISQVKDELTNMITDINNNLDAFAPLPVDIGWIDFEH